MRYVFALTALALAAVFVVLGIGQTTFLRGEDSRQAVAKPDSSVNYSVIPAEALLAEEGQATIVVEGKKTSFAGYGSAADVEAWLAPYDHQEFTYDKASGTLEGELVPAKAPVLSEQEQKAVSETAATAPVPTEPRNPAGSDLWVGEIVGEGPQTLFVDANESTSVIIASNGSSAQPGKLSLVWVKNATAPWFGPLMVLAGFFALLGILLYLLAVDHDKRSSGPQRGQRGFFLGLRALIRERRQRLAERREQKREAKQVGAVARVALAGATVAVVALTATGCSARYWPSFEERESNKVANVTPEPTESADATATEQEGAAAQVAPVPVSEAQLRRILTRISETTIEADETLSTDLAKTRYAGSALSQREANYKIRAAVSSTPPPLELTGVLLDYQLIQSTSGWPRTILATTESRYSDLQEPPTDADGKPLKSPALSVLLKQDSVYSNFVVHSVAEIRGGTIFPEAAAVDEGVALLPNDVKTLELAPKDVGIAFGQVLAQGEAAPDYDKFDVTDDLLLEQMGQAWVVKSQEEAAARSETVEYSLEMSQQDDVVTLTTGAGGAIVSVTINEKHIAKSTQARGLVKLSPSVKALSGLDGSKKSIYQLWQHQMLFFVPNVDSGEKIRVLGSTTAMTGAGEG